MPLRRAGMTLVEMLVAVGVVTVLLVLVVVSVRPVMLRANELRNSSRISQSLKDIVAYAADHGGEMPNPGIPTDLSRPGRFHYFDYADSIEFRANSYPSFRRAWHRCLASWIGGEYRDTWHAAEGPNYINEEEREAFYEQPYSVRVQYPSRFVYSYAFLSESDIWSDTGAVLSSSDEMWLDHARYVHYDDVSFPSHKGVLIYAEPPAGSPGLLVAFADGSAGWFDPETELREPPFWPTLNHAAEPFRMSHPVIGTVDGYEGRDR